MKRISLVFSLLIFSYLFSFSQSYDFAGGLRFGTGIGFSFKYQPINKMTLEAILASPLKKDELQLSLLAASHNSLITKGFNFYIGGGARRTWDLSEIAEYEDPLAIVAVVGAEFNIARLNISYDLMPSYNIIGGEDDFAIETGLTLRYIFDKRKLFEDRLKNKEKRKKKREKRKKSKDKAKQKTKKEKEKSAEPKWWKFW